MTLKCVAPLTRPRTKDAWLYNRKIGYSQSTINFGTIIKSLPLTDLPFISQTLISEGHLQPGWYNHPHCSTFNVSAKFLQYPYPPTLSKALIDTNRDWDTWLQSYEQEYFDLHNMDIYDEITHDKF